MHYYAFYSPFAPELLTALFPFLILAAIWTLIIKGYALWHAARNGQKEWFIAMLIINTVGILEIVYLVWFRPTSSHSHTPVQSSSPQA